MEVPMLDEVEYAEAHRLYGLSFNNLSLPRKDRFKALLDFYNNLTGFNETEPNAVMHHRLALYGPICENRGKPYRTPKASFCAACGHKRIFVE
jgi:hypothetical protein